MKQSDKEKRTGRITRAIMASVLNLFETMLRFVGCVVKATEQMIHGQQITTTQDNLTALYCLPTEHVTADEEINCDHVRHPGFSWGLGLILW
jgi:hypothetical protein